jgi:hypothetical protein
MDHPRQCVFCASANELELGDVTGNRRIWPIPLAGEVDVTAIERDCEQIWGEAFHWHNKGSPWWLTPEIEAIAAEMQDAYVEYDGFDEKILHVLDQDFSGGSAPFTLPEIARGLGFSYAPADPNFIRKPDESRIARRLRRLGFQPDAHRHRAKVSTVPGQPPKDRIVRYWVPVKGRSR